MSIQFSDTRELKLEVTLSGIAMTQIGTASGTYAAYSSIPDPQNSRFLNYDNRYNNPLISPGNGVNDFLIGKKLRQIPSVQNGYLPEVNTTPSCSSCTFAFGGIASADEITTNGGIHPVFSLLIGPSNQDYTKYGLGLYIVDLTRPQINSAELRPPVIDRDQFIDPLKIANRKAFIPFVRFDKSSNTTYSSNVLQYYQKFRTAYNIWNLYENVYDNNPTTRNVILYDGIVSPATKPVLKTLRLGLEGAKCFVNSIGENNRAIIRRIFPTSKDAAFYDQTAPNYRANIRTSDPAEIFFPTKLRNATTYTPGTILYRDSVIARPYANNGFHINLSNLNVSSNDSSITITLENIGVTKFADLSNSSIVKDIPNNTVYKIDIEITPNNTPSILLYYKVNDKLLEKKFNQIKVPTFNGNPSTDLPYDIFLHFAGPVLLVGFSPDSSTWVSIAADEIQREPTTSIDFYFPAEKSYIYMTAINSSFAFTYSSIIFDNYFYDKKLNDLSGAFVNDINQSWLPIQQTTTAPNVFPPGFYLDTRNYVLVNYRTRHSLRNNLNIQNKLLFNHYLNTFAPLTIGNNSLPVDSPVSFFPDWKNLNNISQTGVSPDVIYAEPVLNPFTALGVVLKTIRPTSPLTYFRIVFSTSTNYPNSSLLLSQNIYEEWGKIFLTSTIEGPLILSTFSEQTVASSTASLLRPINRGNITSYVTDIRIDCNSEHVNNSFINNEAQITLENLDTTEEGWRILELIENNVIVVTVSAGYGNKIFRYFQGAIKQIQTTRSGSKSSTVLYCQDLNSYLLENIYFEKAVSFASLRLGDIIRIIMNCSGFSEFYTDLIAINDAANDFINNEAYKQRLATNAAVNQDLLLATPFDRIKDKLDVFLPKLCKVGQQVVFRWEPGVYSVNANGSNRFLYGFVFDNRYALHNRDVAFKFTGISKNSIDNQLTITSRPELNDDLGWHGLIVDNFSISVNTKPLAFRVETAGFNLIDGLFVENTDNDVDFDSLSRISPLKLNQIVDSLVKTSDPVPTKYIGFRKQVKDYYDRTEFPSSSIMRFKHQQNTQVVSKPFHSIGFDCYVTQPLKFWGTFYINYFDGSDPQNNTVESPVTETYVYSRLTYVINKSSNLITASVQGIRIPWTIRGLEELSS